LEKAQKLLNATMLANPYVLVATVIGGLIATMWILKDSTDANAEATERHNQLRKEQANLIDDEKNRINGLISTIQDETKSWDERNKAFLALKSSTGSVLDKYTSLNQVLREMSQVLKDLNGRYETMNENSLERNHIPTKKIRPHRVTDRHTHVHGRLPIRRDERPGARRFRSNR